MTCIRNAGYSMTAEVYDQTTVQEVSGRIKRDWNTNNPSEIINCLAYIVSAVGSRINFIETWGDQYSNSVFIRIVTDYRPSNRQRVGKVRGRQGSLIQDDSIFDILAVDPVQDVFGNIVEFSVLCAEVMNK